LRLGTTTFKVENTSVKTLATTYGQKPVIMGFKVLCIQNYSKGRQTQNMDYIMGRFQRQNQECAEKCSLLGYYSAE